MAPVIGINRISPGARLVDNDFNATTLEVVTATISGSIVLHTSGENKYTITWTQPTGDDRALTIPAMGANDQFTFNDATQTLTNKALTGVTDLDMTSGNKTILDTIGSNTLTIGAGGTTVVIAGNLTVSGTTTTVDTGTLNIADSLYVLNSDEDGTPSQDSGFIVERGTSTNVGLFWDESADEFVFVNTSEDGTTAGNVTIASYANLQIAKTTGSSLVLDGDKSVTPGDGGVFHIDTHTITDSATSGSGTATKYTHVAIEAPTLAATNSSVTTTDVATFYINAAATAGTNQTITRNYALWVDAGNVRFDGSIYSGTTHVLNSSGLLQVTNQSNIAGVGTITSGTWQGTDVGVAYGGTGVSTLTDGGVLLGSGAGAITAMAVLADSEMIVGDGSTDPVAESGATLRTSIGVGTGDSPQFAGATLASSSADEPILHITNTHAGATSGKLRFNKDSGSGDDNDVMGIIEFYGTDAGEATHERLAYIDSYIIDSAAGSEAAGLRFYVAENDANLTAGLQIQGQADDDAEVDVIIAAGAASTTTIAGTLTMGSTAALTNAGLVAVANQSNITGVGTISSGTWEGTDVAVAHGGTGQSNLNNLITMGTHTTGNYVATLTAGTGLTSTGATSGESIAHSLSVDAAQTGITSVGALDGGSITSNFGTIDTGASAITTTGLISGGSLDIDNVLINGTTIGHTDDTDLITVADGSATLAGILIIDGDKSVTPGDGSALHIDQQTVTDSNTAGSGTAGNFRHVSIEPVTLAATNSSVTTTNAATLYIADDVQAGTNQTLTNNYAIWVNGGTVRLDGTLNAAAITGSAIDASSDFTVGDTVITDGGITDSSNLALTTTSTGALTITSAAAATWSTGAGVLTIDGDDGVIIQATSATAGVTIADYAGVGNSVSTLSKYSFHIDRDFSSSTNAAQLFIHGNMTLTTGTSDAYYIGAGGDFAGVIDISGGGSAHQLGATMLLYEPNLTTTDGSASWVYGVTLKIASAPTEGTTDNYALWVDSGKSRFDSAVIIGASTSTNNYLDDASNGSGSTTMYIGNQSITTSSDSRIKKDIVDTSVNAIETLDQLRVVDFMWDDPTDIGPNNRNMRGQWTGMIAQEVVDVVPYIINAPRTEDGGIDYDDESTWMVDYQHLVPMLVKAIQELNQELQEIKGGN